MAFQFNIQHNLGDALKKLENIENSLEHRKALMQKAGGLMVSSVHESYTKQKGPKKEKWPGLNLEKYPYRPSKGGVIRWGKNPTDETSKPLINTGMMRAALNFTLVDRGESVIIGYGSPKQAEKAQRHQFGIPGTAKIEIPKMGGFTITMKPRKRPQIGFAEWNRLDGAKDVEHIKNLFRSEIQRILRDS